MTCPTECKVELERRVKKSTVLIIVLALIGTIGATFLYAIGDRMYLESKVSAAETKVERTIDDVNEIAAKQDSVMQSQAAMQQAVVDIRADVADIKKVNRTILYNQVEAVKQMRVMIKEALDNNGR